LEKKLLFKKFSLAHQDKLPFSLNFNWWNEVVCENWEVGVVSNQSQVFAVLPYFITKKGPWKVLSNPHFTPYTGSFYSYPEGQKTSSKISFENKMNQKLIDQLPEFAMLNINCHLRFFNSLSFLWNGFEDHRRYTYLLDLQLNPDDIWSNFRENIRREIRKAEKNLSIKINNDPVLLEKCLQESFQSQKQSYPPISSAYYERILNYVKKYNCGRSWKAVDSNGDIHAAVCCVWDQKTAYYLLGGSISRFKNSGAISLLLWQAIQESQSQKLNSFNFEGSTIKGIEHYLRGFGGSLHSFSNLISKPSKSLRLAKSLKV